MNKSLFLIVLVLLSSFVYAEECSSGQRQSCGPKNEAGSYTSEGQCEVGYQKCVNGLWGICLGAVYPSEEKCGDKTDNDCNGEVDEICECSSGQVRQCGETDIGNCQYGIENCANRRWSGFCEGAVYPADEVCNDNLDNDCDSFVDEDCGNVTSASCFNNIKDGDELGIDCSGSCPVKCINCVEGEIKRSCYCGDVIYDSGYCCNSIYQNEPCSSREYLTKGGYNYTVLSAKEEVSEAFIPWYIYVIVLILLISAIWFYLRKVIKPKKVVEIPISSQPFKVKITEGKAKALPKFLALSIKLPRFRNLLNSSSNVQRLKALFPSSLPVFLARC